MLAKPRYYLAVEGYLLGRRDGILSHSAWPWRDSTSPRRDTNIYSFVYMAPPDFRKLICRVRNGRSGTSLEPSRFAQSRGAHEKTPPDMVVLGSVRSNREVPPRSRTPPVRGNLEGQRTGRSQPG